LYVFALSHSLYSPFTVTLHSRKDRFENIFMTMNWRHLELPCSQWRQLSQEFSEKGTRLIPQGDNFQNRTKLPAWPRLTAQPSHKTNQTTPVTGTVIYAYRILGVLVLGTKLWFQFFLSEYSSTLSYLFFRFGINLVSNHLLPAVSYFYSHNKLHKSLFIYSFIYLCWGLLSSTNWPVQ
jgi:hypothetical protein